VLGEHSATIQQLYATGSDLQPGVGQSDELCAVGFEMLCQHVSL
jgi:hypothetical protein